MADTTPTDTSETPAADPPSDDGATAAGDAAPPPPRRNENRPAIVGTLSGLLAGLIAGLLLGAGIAANTAAEPPEPRDRLAGLHGVTGRTEGPWTRPHSGPWGRPGEPGHAMCDTEWPTDTPRGPGADTGARLGGEGADQRRCDAARDGGPPLDAPGTDESAPPAPPPTGNPGS